MHQRAPSQSAIKKKFKGNSRERNKKISNETLEKEIKKIKTSISYPRHPSSSD